MNTKQDQWTDELIMEFARVASGGAYGDYLSCVTLESKLERFKELKGLEKANIYQRIEHALKAQAEMVAAYDEVINGLKEEIEKAERAERRAVLTFLESTQTRVHNLKYALLKIKDGKKDEVSDAKDIHLSWMEIAERDAIMLEDYLATVESMYSTKPKPKTDGQQERN